MKCVKWSLTHSMYIISHILLFFQYFVTLSEIKLFYILLLLGADRRGAAWPFNVILT